MTCFFAYLTFWQLPLLLAVLLAAPDQPQANPVDVLTPGQSSQEVSQQLGRPDQIARQILHRRHFEQWIYPRQSLVVELVRKPGQGLVVVQIHKKIFR